MVAESEFAGDFASGRGEADFAARFHADQAVFLQAAQGHGYRGRRDLQQVGEARGDDRFAFALRFEDRLEVVLLGDGDH